MVASRPFKTSQNTSQLKYLKCLKQKCRCLNIGWDYLYINWIIIASRCWNGPTQVLSISDPSTASGCGDGIGLPKERCHPGSKTSIYAERFLRSNLSHPFLDGIFPEINQPYFRGSLYLWKPPYIEIVICRSKIQNMKENWSDKTRNLEWFPQTMGPPTPQPQPPSQAALGGEWWWESMPVSSTSSLMRSNPVSFRMQKAEPLSPADHRQTMRMRILKWEVYGDAGGVVRLKWGNIEDAMDWFLQVLKRNALLKPPKHRVLVSVHSIKSGKNLWNLHGNLWFIY